MKAESLYIILKRRKPHVITPAPLFQYLPQMSQNEDLFLKVITTEAVTFTLSKNK